MKDLAGELDCSKAQDETDEALLEVVRTALVLSKTASKERISNYVNEREKLAAERSSLDVVSGNNCDKSESMVSPLRTTVENDTNCAEEEAKQCKKLLATEKGLRTQLRLRANDSDKLEDLKY